MNVREVVRWVVVIALWAFVVWMATGPAVGRASAKHPIWVTDTRAAQLVQADVTPFGNVQCVGYGHRKAYTQRWRRFHCLGDAGDNIFESFTIRTTSHGIEYKPVVSG